MVWKKAREYKTVVKTNFLGFESRNGEFFSFASFFGFCCDLKTPFGNFCSYKFSHQMGSSRMYPPSNVITETSISVTNADSDEDKKANSSEEVSHVESVKLRPLLDGNRSVTTPSFETGKWSPDERMNVEDSNHKTGKTISSQHGNEDSLNRSSPVPGGPSNSRCVNSDQEPVIDQMRSRSKTLPVPTRHPVRKMETAGGDCSSTDAIESAMEDNTSHHLSAGKGKKRRRSFVNLIPQTLPRKSKV